MTSLIKVLFPTFRVMGTVENAGSTSALAPNVDDPQAYSDKVWAALNRGASRQD